MFNPEIETHPERFSASEFMYRVFGWMTIALAITAGTAYYLSSMSRETLMANQGLFLGVIIGQIALVIVLSMFILRLSLPVAVGMFLFYSFLMGITTSFIFQLYTPVSIYTTFVATAAMFGAMALYGYFTKTDLSSIGSMGLMVLIGLIVGMLINMFLKSPMFDYFISAVGVVLFTLLTAYDTQKLKMIAKRLYADKATMEKIAVVGALSLYLDFVNLFMFLLRFTGKQRD